MKTKALLFVLASCVLALSARYVHVPNGIQADDIPEKYRDTVHKGLEYLVKNQHKDGHWEGDDGKHPVAMTGLVGLALLMERDAQTSRRGRARDEAKYVVNINKAADWLMDKSQAGRDGLIFSEHPSETSRYMQGHGLATIFLAGAVEDQKDDASRRKIIDVLTRAVKYIIKAQSTQGGWYHTSKMEGHDFDTISATVIQIQALQAAENVGIPFPSEAVSDAQECLKKAVGKHEAGTKPERNPGRQADIAGALACRYRPNPAISRARDDTKEGMNENWLKYCRSEIPLGRDIKHGRDELAHYYYAQAVYKIGGDTWTGYRAPLFDHLQSTQNKNGSWPASDGLSVGQVYSTALWCTVLQLDKRSHPSTRRVIEIID